MHTLKRSLFLASLAFVLSVLASLPAAASEIVPGQGFNGITLGAAQDAVKVHLGSPDKSDIIRGDETWTYFLCGGDLALGIQWNSQRKVESVTLLTLNPSDKVKQWIQSTNTVTSKGITLGTSVEDVLSKMGRPVQKVDRGNTTYLGYPGLLVHASDGKVIGLRVLPK